MTFKHRIGLAAVAALLAVVAAPAVASAATVFVSHSPVVAGGKSCPEPNYNSVQAAITASPAGAKIDVCSGTYEEQLQITKSVSLLASGTPEVKLPAAPANSTTECGETLSAAPEQAGSPVQDEIDICGAGVAVAVKGLAIDAAWPESACNDNLYGVFVGDGASLSLSNSSILAAGPQPINGCQGGIGIEVGTGRTTPAETGTASLSNVLVEGYQKNGINVIGKGSKATLKKVTVKGAGLTNVIAQNGFEVGEGAEASAGKSSFSDNRYEGANSATGMIVFEETAGPTVSKSTFENDDLGIDYEESGTATLTVTSSRFLGDTYDGVFLLEGNAVLNKDTFDGGEDGIGLFQFSGETHGPTGTGSKDKIENMSSYAVAGFSDGAAGDPSGFFKISNSKISDNPTGASVQHSVFSESNSLEIITEHDS
jgi:hypothetical protein